MHCDMQVGDVLTKLVITNAAAESLCDLLRERERQNDTVNQTQGVCFVVSNPYQDEREISIRIIRAINGLWLSGCIYGT